MVSPQKQSSAAPESENPSVKVLELIANWVELYAGNYGKEPTAETSTAYRIGLSDLRPNLLHRAFGRCLRECSFWPNVAEIRKAYAIEAEEVSPSRALPEADHEWTADDRQTWAQLMQQTGEKLKVSRRAAPLSDEEFAKRKLLLKKQAEELTAKAKGDGK